MKRIFQVLFIILLVSVYNCNNEPLDEVYTENTNENNGENNEGTASSLVGSWSMDSFDVTINSITDFSGTTIESLVETSSTETNYFLNFTESAYTTSGSYSYDVDVSVAGQGNNSSSETVENVSGSGTYTTNGNTLTSSGSFFEYTYEGIDDSLINGEQSVNYQITNNGNTLTFTQNETDTQSQLGITTTTITASISVWTRVENTTITDCEIAQNATASAVAAYNNDTSNTSLCEAYSAALENEISECGDTNGTLQEMIDNLENCTTQTATGILKVTTGTLPIDFITRTATLSNGKILVNGSNTEQGADYHIYFEVTEGNTGTDVMENFLLTLNGGEYVPNTDGFDDFTSTVTLSSNGTIQGTFGGIVSRISDGADLSLTQGQVDMTY